MEAGIATISTITGFVSKKISGSLKDPVDDRTGFQYQVFFPGISEAWLSSKGEWERSYSLLQSDKKIMSNRHTVTTTEHFSCGNIPLLMIPGH